MINVVNLTYSCSDKVILDNINLCVERGVLYAIAGENGAGKSTLIKIILDLIRNVDQGDVTIAGRSREQQSSREALCYLDEKFDIDSRVTGWDYLELVSGLFKLECPIAKVKELCDALGLEVSDLAKKTGQYSKGMKQKLGLIGCFMLELPLMILDEPLSGLDPRARYLFKQLLKKENLAGRTVFYSTHMLADAEEICDKFGILHRGRIVFEGTPQQCIGQFGAANLEEAYMRCISAV